MTKVIGSQWWRWYGLYMTEIVILSASRGAYTNELWFIETMPSPNDTYHTNNELSIRTLDRRLEI